MISHYFIFTSLEVSPSKYFFSSPSSLKVQQKWKQLHLISPKGFCLSFNNVTAIALISLCHTRDTREKCFTTFRRFRDNFIFLS